MRIILLTVQFKPKNLCTPWPKHALLTTEGALRGCNIRGLLWGHPPSWRMLGGGSLLSTRWTACGGPCTRCTASIQPSLTPHTLSPSLRMRCSREVLPGQCLRQRAGRIEATDLVPAQQLPMGRVPISTPMCRTCAPPPVLSPVSSHAACQMHLLVLGCFNHSCPNVMQAVSIRLTPVLAVVPLLGRMNRPGIFTLVVLELNVQDMMWQGRDLRPHVVAGPEMAKCINHSTTMKPLEFQHLCQRESTADSVAAAYILDSLHRHFCA